MKPQLPTRCQLALLVLLFAACSESPTAPPSGGKSSTFNGFYFGEPTGNSYRNVKVFSNYRLFRNGTVVPTTTKAYVDNAGNVIYSPTSTGQVVDTTGKTSTGTAFECVELVRRFYWLQYGVLPPNLNAGDFWNQPVSKMGAVRRVTDGYSTVLLQADDIVVMGNTSNGVPVEGNGHVAIVSQISTSSVTYFQENTNSDLDPKPVTTVQLAGSLRYKLTPIGGAGTAGYYMKGWFTRGTHSQSSPSITGFAPLGARASTTTVTVSLLTTGIVDLDDVVVLLTDPLGRSSSFSIATGTVRPTPLGVVFDTKLATSGNWTAQLNVGSATSATYAFAVNN